MTYRRSDTARTSLYDAERIALGREQVPTTSDPASVAFSGCPCSLTQYLGTC